MEFLETLGFEAYPAIVVICFGIGLLWKTSPLPDEWIPVVCMFFGGLLGFVAMTICPSFPAQDPLWAIATGMFSGLAATGLHQIYKQATKKGAHEE